MTDPEISKALALAIGWKPNQIRDVIGGDNGRPLIQASPVHFARPFDYRDWNVIGPIAAKYDCFPVIAPCHGDEWLSTFMGDSPSAFADTPQKAIAMAVIQGAKK